MDIHGIAPLLQVFDMPIAIHFYRDVLGFKVHATSQPGDDCNWAWLKLNGAELMLNTAYEADQRPAAPQPAPRFAGAAKSVRGDRQGWPAKRSWCAYRPPGRRSLANARSCASILASTTAKSLVTMHAP